MKKNISAIFAISILLVVAAACGGSFTTANISELRFGTNNKAEPAATTFNTGEDIYALAVVSNASGKYKLNWKITYDKVTGKDPGQEVGTNTVDFDGSKQLWQSFSTPLPGEYKIVATLTGEDGKQIDSKEGMVTVNGTDPAAPTSDDGKKGDDGDK